MQKREQRCKSSIWIVLDTLEPNWFGSAVSPESLMNAMGASWIPELVTLWAEQGHRPSMSLLERLAPDERVRVVAALVVIIAFGGLLLIGIRAGGRIARWYVNCPVGCGLPATDGHRSLGNAGVSKTLPKQGEARVPKRNEGSDSRGGSNSP